MVGASSLVDDLDTGRRLEDAGSAAIVTLNIKYLERFRRIKDAERVPVVGSLLSSWTSADRKR
jgi:hypothetical protein